MDYFDRWPREWRDLANEYGYNLAVAAMDECSSIDEAEFKLEARRYNMQQQQLATDYHFSAEKFLARIKR